MGVAKMGKTMLDKRGTKGSQGGRVGMALLAAAAIFGNCGVVGAFEIQTGNEDIKVNWDNSFRYTLGTRIGSQDPAIVANPNLDDGDRNFNHGIVANRLDVLSEFDVSYKKKYGIRLSGTAWYDQAYDDGLNNSSLATSNHLDRNGNQSFGLDPYTRRLYAGPSGELMDAFAFGKFEVAEIPIQVKVGRHTLYFGETLSLTGALNGISYAQSPLDIAKAYAIPGVNVKELFRPLNSVSVTAQPASTFSITGQALLQWEPNRYPESGTYLGIYDYLLNSAETILDPSLGKITSSGDITPYSIGDWGVAARWTPDFLNDVTLGFYYRNFSDKLPQAHIVVNPGVDTSRFSFAYASDIDLYGVSVTKQILGISTSAELSYRHNMPLLSDTAIYTSALDLPRRGQTGGARGDTWHGVVNALGLINRTPLFDSASWSSEFSWNRWGHVTQHGELFIGRDSYSGINKVTKDAVAVDLTFAPTWFQVFPGVDLSMPLAYGRGLYGNSATGVSNEDGGYWSTGISADILSRYKVDLTYADYFGKYSTDPAGAVAINNGDYALLKDRGTLSLTLRTTF